MALGLGTLLNLHHTGFGTKSRSRAVLFSSHSVPLTALRRQCGYKTKMLWQCYSTLLLNVERSRMTFVSRFFLANQKRTSVDRFPNQYESVPFSDSTQQHTARRVQIDYKLNYSCESVLFSDSTPYSATSDCHESVLCDSNYKSVGAVSVLGLCCYVKSRET